MNLKAFVLAGLVFAAFWYLSTIAKGFSIGIPTPFGYFPLFYPFAGMAQPILIVGGFLAVVIFIMMVKRGKPELE